MLSLDLRESRLEQTVVLSGSRADRPGQLGVCLSANSACDLFPGRAQVFLARAQQGTGKFAQLGLALLTGFRYFLGVRPASQELRMDERVTREEEEVLEEPRVEVGGRVGSRAAAVRLLQRDD